MKANILVVDDDREIVNAITKLLELNDFNTFSAYNGKDALEILLILTKRRHSLCVVYKNEG